MSSIDEGSVTRRRVFYIPGYDPFPARRYRELYRTESAAQASISGYTLSQSATEQGWTVQAEIDGRQVQTEIEVLVWSDIVQDSMQTGVLATYGQLLRTSWIYVSTGALWRLMRLRKGPVIAALYPVVMLLGQAVIALLAALFAGAMGVRLFAWLSLPPALGLAISIALGVALAIGLLRWFKRRDGRVFAHYLMHDYAHSASLKGETPPALAERLGQFTQRVSAALREDVDEVLIVGHSSGAHLAVTVLADALRTAPMAAARPALSFLSLGQVVPMVSFLPKAQRLRRDLHDLSISDQLTWVDVTAPGDGCAFALCDPVAVSGVAPADKRWPLVFSAAFTQSLSPARWRALRWRFFRLHFQYLCAFDQPKDYDYFQITAGPITLAQRYAGRVASRSRILSPVNKFTSRAA